MQSATIRLRSGETAIVGYGSLLSLASVGRTLGRAYDGPFVPASVDGWRRCWNVAMPNEAFYCETGGERLYPARILYLNVRPERGSFLSCVVFAVTAEELAAMDDREFIYDRRVVTPQLRGVEVEGGDAVMYVGRSDCIVEGVASPRDAAIRASYLRVLDGALRALSAAARAAYEGSTDALPRHLVIEDRLDAQRPHPWAAAGRRHSPEAHMQG